MYLIAKIQIFLPFLLNYLDLVCSRKIFQLILIFYLYICEQIPIKEAIVTNKTSFGLITNKQNIPSITNNNANIIFIFANITDQVFYLFLL
jgi:hypothetical protein